MHGQYAFALQEAIKYHCKFQKVPEEIAKDCCGMADMLDNCLEHKFYISVIPFDCTHADVETHSSEQEAKDYINAITGSNDDLKYYAKIREIWL